MGDPLDCPFALCILQQREDQRCVVHVGFQQGLPHGCAQLLRMLIQAQAAPFQQGLAGQGVAVGVQPRRGKAQQHIPGSNFPPLDQPAGIHCSDDRPADVDLPGSVEIRFLGNQVFQKHHAVAAAAPLGRLDHGRNQPLVPLVAAEVEHEADAPGSLTEDIVQTVMDDILGQPRCPSRAHPYLGFCSNPVHAEHQGGLLEFPEGAQVDFGPGLRLGRSFGSRFTDGKDGAYNLPGSLLKHIGHLGGFSPDNRDLGCRAKGL